MGKLLIAHTHIIGVAKKLELAKMLGNDKPLTTHTLKGVAEKMKLDEAISMNMSASRRRWASACNAVPMEALARRPDERKSLVVSLAGVDVFQNEVYEIL